MITIMFTAILVALAAVVVLRPLWSREADVLNDFGREGPDSDREVRSRLGRDVEAIRDLDFALAEGKIDEDAYKKERERLTKEAAAGVARMRRKREEARKVPFEHARTYAGTGVVASLVMLVTVVGLVFYVNTHDMQRSVSPHASGQIPLTPEQRAQASQLPPLSTLSQGDAKIAATPNAPFMNGEGAPDPKEMVKRLEERIAKSEPTPQDLAMLARSYRVLGREKDILGLYRDAAKRAPDNPDILLLYGMSLFDSGTEQHRQEAFATFDRVLTLRPDMPEALWFKSLIYVKRHEIDPAKEILTKLQGLVKNNPDANNAVTSLLAALNSDYAPANGAQHSPKQNPSPKTQ